MITRFFFFCICSLLCFPAKRLIAQEHFCGQHLVTSQWFQKFPEKQKQYLETCQSTRRHTIKNKLRGPSGSQLITIPVVFHILHVGGSENISEAQIKDQIRILNRDFQKQNPDTASVVSAFKSNIANVGFAFELATKDPQGNCTNGIVRHFTSKTNWDANALEDFIYSWPTDQYLNFYIVKSINIAPAYTFLPGIGIPPEADVIVSQHNLVGSTGTANIANSRALTHEVGHWFGLPHTWGVSNAPGVSCGDDFVEDTPLTKGFTACNLQNARICDPSIEENVQNYMDYSPCKIMFTNGQAAYMTETIDLGINRRDYLVSEENHMKTGVAGFLACQTKADFNTSKNVVCLGDSVKLVNVSRSGNETLSITWEIPGGIPDISQDSVLFVRFESPGQYVIRLIADGGANGLDTMLRTMDVTDGYNGQVPDVLYRLDTNQTPAGWSTRQIPDDNIRWSVISGTGAENSPGCMALLNFSDESTAGNKDYFETGFFDLSLVNKPRFSYTYSYAKKSESQADSFRVEYSLDCGQSWKSLLGIPGVNSMANNTGGVTGDYYIPRDDQWKKVSVANTLANALRNKPSVKFRFYFKSDPAGQGSNNLYIDEINVQDETITGMDDMTSAVNIKVIPNPSSGHFTIQTPNLNGIKNNICIYNAGGEPAGIPDLVSCDNDTCTYATETPLSPGVYFIKVMVPDAGPVIKKCIVVR